MLSISEDIVHHIFNCHGELLILTALLEDANIYSAYISHFLKKLL